MDVKFEATVCRVLVEKEFSVYQDWSGLKQVKQGPVIDSDLETASEDVHEKEDYGGSVQEEKVSQADAELATASGRFEFSDTLLEQRIPDALRDLIEVGYTTRELLDWVYCAALIGVNGADVEEKVLDDVSHSLQLFPRSNVWKRSYDGRDCKTRN